MTNSSKMRVAGSAALLGALVAATGCSADRLVQPNLNSATPQGAAADPVGAINLLAGGIQGQARDQAGGWVIGVGILGREAFNYTGTESRNTSGWLVNPDDGSSFGGGALWGGRYVNLRNILLLNQVAATAPITDAQKAGVRGFARTYEALELHYVALRNDAIGGPVEVFEKPDSIAPFVSRDSIYSRVVGRLNEGATDLRAAGPSFVFTLGRGFTGFTTPATFLQVNRALAARVLAYRGSLATGTAAQAFYTQALTALGESFLDPAGDLQAGAYYTFSTAPGETTNSATSFGGQARVVVAHPSTTVDAPTRADGSADLRVAAKTTTLATIVSPSFCAVAPGCIGTTVGFTRYPAQDSPIPLVKNEELVLLRAEARYFTGNVAGAVEDLNVVRTRSGGLAPIGVADVATADAFVTELLRQRRYSLLFEGHRWVDLRRFGRLATLPLDRTTHKVVSSLAVPQQECLSRARTGVAALRTPACPQ